MGMLTDALWKEYLQQIRDRLKEYDEEQKKPYGDEYPEITRDLIADVEPLLDEVERLQAENAELKEKLELAIADLSEYRACETCKFWNEPCPVGCYVPTNKFDKGDIVRVIEKERCSGEYYGYLFTVDRVSYDGFHISYDVSGNGIDVDYDFSEHELELVKKFEVTQ